MRSLKILSALIVSISLMSTGQIAAMAAHAAENTSNEAIFFVPHQDDEILSMGAAIASHVQSGRDVHLVLVTDGSASSALKTVNARLVKEKLPQLSKKEFSEARNREFKMSAKALGVKESNLHFENQVDGTMTPNKAGVIVDKYLKLYPGASFKSMSWLDNHRDHYSMGYALNNRCVRNQKIDCRFYQSPIYRQDLNHPSSNASTKVPTPQWGFNSWKGNEGKLVNAANAYNTWNPSEGFYAIGNTSVASSFNFLRTQKESSKYHKNNSNWRNSSEYNTAKNWQAKRGTVS